MMKNFALVLIFLSITRFSFSQTTFLSAGSNQKIRGGEVVFLRGVAKNVKEICWVTNGSGTFSNKNSLITTYTPGMSDLLTGSVKITLTTPENTAISSSIELKIVDCNTIIFKTYQDTICGYEELLYYKLEPKILGSHFYCKWETNGKGSFDSPENISATYLASKSDISPKPVILKLTVYDSLGTCETVADSLFLYINEPAGINLPDSIIRTCGDEPIKLKTDIYGSSDTVIWSTNGLGRFEKGHSIFTEYNPVLADRSTILSFRAETNDPIGPCPASNDIVNVEIFGPAVYIGGNIEECAQPEGGFVELDANTTANCSFVWSTNGTGKFNSPNNFSTRYNYTPEDVKNNFVKIYATVSGKGCLPVTDSIVVKLQEAPDIQFAEPMIYECLDKAIPMEVFLSGFASNGFWSTTGQGYFENPFETSTSYHPSNEDLTEECLYFTFTTDDPKGPCASVNETLFACFTDCDYNVITSNIESENNYEDLIKFNNSTQIMEVDTRFEIDPLASFIRDISGKKVKLQFHDDNLIQLSDISSGIYFIHLTSIQGQILTKKIIINN